MDYRKIEETHPIRVAMPNGAIIAFPNMPTEEIEAILHDWWAREQRNKYGHMREKS
jgi:hypothetical protein